MFEYTITFVDGSIWSHAVMDENPFDVCARFPHTFPEILSVETVGKVGA